MKKLFKIIAVVMCIAMVGVILCSCQYLDDKKALHAIYNDDSKETFTFRDYKYLRMKFDNDVNSDVNLLITNDMETAYVTTEDVPVLLADNFGDMLYYNGREENPVVMNCDSMNDESYYSYAFTFSGGIQNLRSAYFDSRSSDAENRFYVREDKYDELKKAIDSAVMDSYYTWNYNYNDDKYNYYNDDDDLYHLETISDDAVKAINETIKSGKKITYTEFGSADMEGMDFNMCDKNMLVTNNYGVLLLKDNDEYYLVRLKDGSAISNDLIQVPEKQKEELAKLYTKYYDNSYSFMLDEYFYDQLLPDSSDDVVTGA